jgi:hypothetical protein
MNDDFEDSPARSLDQHYVRQGRIIIGLLILFGAAIVALVIFGPHQ